ncbi:hypothetical protein HPB50_009918 [Hyalomma asiaticum]|uniref:Uncharacterized protein n=1 Tax=Hyalomma asiaticum TaxID=266040 RepID=A0ACB7TF35_HYAAI|nr:hypothetical protein HPB50_009918 [Hyalomma asiaticum]
MVPNSINLHDYMDTNTDVIVYEELNNAETFKSAYTAATSNAADSSDDEVAHSLPVPVATSQVMDSLDTLRSFLDDDWEIMLQKPIIWSGPPLCLDLNPKKLQFLSNFELTSHQKKRETLEDGEQSDTVTDEALNTDNMKSGLIESNFVTATDTFQEFVDARELELAVCEEASTDDAIIAAVHGSAEVASNDNSDGKDDVDPAPEPDFPCKDALNTSR